ncbi:MAG: hypothetical protein V4690_00890 [Patescibacteria group bacterium]
MEEFKSKYYNIDAFRQDWTKDELVPVLSFLESADLNTLQTIVTNCGVTFTGGNEDVKDEEQLINVLFSDVTKEKLKTEISKHL